MDQYHADLAWLENPEVFAVNRLEAHSDHRFYESREEADGGIMKLRQSLNGIWKFSYAPKPEQRKKDFYKPERSLGDFGEITVPGHIELQGYGKCQYINTMYPWEGHSEIKPPHVDWEDNPVGSYVKEFETDAALKNKRLFLSFQGVESPAGSRTRISSGSPVFSGRCIFTRCRNAMCVTCLSIPEFWRT